MIQSKSFINTNGCFLLVPHIPGCWNGIMFFGVVLYSINLYFFIYDYTVYI